MTQSIDIMGETLLSAIQKEENVDNIKALYSEWVVDGQDPEDGEYQFLYLPVIVGY